MTKWKDTYPRPQLVRDKWLSLDGEWTFSIKKTSEAGLPPKPGKINVPFCPESMLSGLNRITRQDELMLYGRGFTVPEEWKGMNPDFGAFVGHCQFHDCSHRAEPGCAVTAAVADGRVERSRYDSYLRLYEKSSQIKLWERK